MTDAWRAGLGTGGKSCSCSSAMGFVPVPADRNVSITWHLRWSRSNTFDVTRKAKMHSPVFATPLTGLVYDHATVEQRLLISRAQGPHKSICKLANPDRHVTA